jgi:hypothetical protein
MILDILRRFSSAGRGSAVVRRGVGGALRLLLIGILGELAESLEER